MTLFVFTLAGDWALWRRRLAKCPIVRADTRGVHPPTRTVDSFVANAPDVLGFDPTARFVDYIVRVAQRGTRRLAA